ncbi:hypothetical protein B0H13DRAFT_1926751 [Mycena leptocephala]|nr:hypothetical protein B0H13DRAFT_1926751 [Mycena leptocephala]
MFEKLPLRRSPRNKKQCNDTFWDTADVVLYLLQYLNLLQLVNLSHVDKRFQVYVKEYLKGRITRYTSPFFTRTIAPIPRTRKNMTFVRFFQVLEDTKSWIVGSIPLAAASVLSDPVCPTNLNIITHDGYMDAWIDFMLAESKFVLTDRSWSSGPYSTTAKMFYKFAHPLIRNYVVTITTSRAPNLGGVFFAGPNTDQLVAIAAYELITPVLMNVSEQQHLMCWRPEKHRYYMLSTPRSQPTRITPRFEGATTLDKSTASWQRPCGLSCPGAWRSVRGLKGFAHLKWGGLDDMDNVTDPALLDIAMNIDRGGLTGPAAVCITQTAPNWWPYDLNTVVRNNMGVTSLDSFLQTGVGSRARKNPEYMLSNTTGSQLKGARSPDSIYMDRTCTRRPADLTSP